MPSMLGWSGRLWRREGARVSLMASASQGCSLADWPSVRSSRSYPPLVCRRLLWRWASATRPMHSTDRRTRVTTAKTTRWHLLIYWRDGRAAAGLPYPLPSRMSSAACVPRPPHLRGCRHTPQGSLRGVWRTPRCREVADEQETRPEQEHGAGIHLDGRRRCQCAEHTGRHEPGQGPSANCPSSTSRP